jgi:hypothetical protein
MQTFNLIQEESLTFDPTLTFQITANNDSGEIADLLPPRNETNVLRSSSASKLIYQIIIKEKSKLNHQIFSDDSLAHTRLLHSFSY